MTTTTQVHFEILSRLLLLIILVAIGYLGFTYAPSLAEPLRERIERASSVK